MTFENWCPRRQDKSPLTYPEYGHESAGPVRQSTRGKFYEVNRFVLFTEDAVHPIELHVCKHCGCVYAEVKS